MSVKVKPWVIDASIMGLMLFIVILFCIPLGMMMHKQENCEKKAFEVCKEKNYSPTDCVAHVELEC